MTCSNKYCLLTVVILLCIGVNYKKSDAERLPGAGRLPDSEVEALKEIAEQLGKYNWNFNVNPCNDSSWIRASYIASNSTVICNCSFPNGVCHVIKIFSKRESLAGILPPALAKLPNLETVDFSSNCLRGTIPKEWASMKLQFLYLPENNLSGPIDYLGKITTLKFLSLESNLFTGSVPPVLGNLVDLEELVLSANNFTGELPANLTNLAKLRDFRITSNSFTGRVPNFFHSWKQLQYLEMLGTGLEGPIPSNISVLSNLAELRISDLVGDGSTFPLLKSMRNLTELILRNCNISGRIPEYILELTQLQLLDVSFNKLEGEIPDLENLTKLGSIYLTGNLLSGRIPYSIRTIDNRFRDFFYGLTSQIDLSYNNFARSSAPSSCPNNLNLFRSFIESDNSILSECLINSPCLKDRYSLHINCGGNATTIGDIKYEADLERGGFASFVRMNGDTWGFSGTGQFLDAPSRMDFIVENRSMLSMNDSPLYMNARVSPLSLTYFARCLANGNYSIKLHFAEIVFRGQGNRSYYSLGRRMFDIYIQNVLVLKDFDMKKEAQGIDKTIVRNFTAIVKNKTLEIRFYWAGKGTRNIPTALGRYGPLISAITINSGE